MDEYAAYVASGEKIADILAFHVKKYGTPPAILANPMEVEVNKVDFGSMQEAKVPEGVQIVVSVEKFIIPKHILIKLAERKEE